MELKTFRREFFREYVMPVALAIPFSLLLFFLLPFSIEKYRLDLEKSPVTDNLHCAFYWDLDTDGYAEYIRMKTDFGIPAITIEWPTGTNQQINLKGVWVENSRPLIMDFNQDGHMEIFGFVYHQDSIYLAMSESFSASGSNVRYSCIDRVSLYQGKQDWGISTCVSDVTGDGVEDVLISLYAGFSLKPRKLYVYNPVSGIVRKQKRNFLNNITSVMAMDLDGDGNKEITGNSFAPDNYGEGSGLYPDSLSWFMLFNSELEISRYSRAMGSVTSKFFPFRLEAGEQSFLGGLAVGSQEAGRNNMLYLWEWEGDSLKTVRRKEVNYDRFMRIISSKGGERKRFYLFSEGDVLEYNTKLKKFKTIKTGLPGDGTRWRRIDLNNDGRPENLAFTTSGEFVVFDANFQHPVTSRFVNPGRKHFISNYNKDGQLYIFIYSPFKSGLFKYTANSFYPLRWSVLLAILMINVFIFRFVFQYQKKRLEKRHETQSRLLKYQLANVQQQLEPHFLFNAINNISHFYREGKKEEAYDYVSKMSRLIVSSMENSEKVSIPVQEELSFVRNYLSLEQLRKGNFSYEIEVEGKDLLQTGIPKMLIQNFVENSIKHGIRHLTERKGIIRVYSREDQGSWEIIIADNGIGRRRAAELRTHGTKKGLRTLERILALHEELNKSKLSFRIEDLHDENGDPEGTRVVIRIQK